MADSSQNLVTSFWGEDEFADATIIMGQKKWRVHRLVICKQSQYFARALEGHFEESKTKTINLTGCEFLEEEVDGLLKYLYTHQLDARQQRHMIRTYVTADYFQVMELRDKAAAGANSELRKLLVKKFFIKFTEWCHVVLTEHANTPLETTVLQVIADNIRVVMYESGAWDDLITAFPDMAPKVLEALFPKPKQATGFKRSAGTAFDDTLQAALTGRKPGFNRFGQAFRFSSSYLA